MLGLILRRLLWMVPTFFLISVVSFAIIQLPPGDFLSSYIAAREASGERVAEEEVAALRQRYHLDRPMVAWSTTRPSPRSSASGCC